MRYRIVKPLKYKFDPRQLMLPICWADNPPKPKPLEGDPPPEKPATENLRKKAVKLLQIYRFQVGKDSRAAWTEAYAAMFRATGFHPVVEASRMGLPTHLDAVERRGLLGSLITIIENLLLTPHGDCIPTT